MKKCENWKKEKILKETESFIHYDNLDTSRNGLKTLDSLGGESRQRERNREKSETNTERDTKQEKSKQLGKRWKWRV